MQITYMPDAVKDLKRIGHVAAAKVMDKMSSYATNPAAFANQVKKLHGEESLRLRVGDCRVLFTENGLVLNVLRVGHRREVYR